MTVMRIQDELEPHLSNRGFIRKGKRFVGSSGDLDMIVAFNPDVRIRHLRTIDVICVFPAGRKLEGDYPEGTFYVFDQAYAVSRDWRFSYEEGMPGWPNVIVDDFVSSTIPFIEAATSRQAVFQMILEGDAPPSNGKRQPVGSVIDAYNIARAVDSQAMAQEVVSFAEQLQLSRSDHEWLRDWAAREQVPLDLPDPLSGSRLSIRELFRRNRRSSP